MNEPIKGNITCSLGDGTSIPFWTVAWTRSVNLAVRFTKLFRVSISKNNVVADMGSWQHSRWCSGDLGIKSELGNFSLSLLQNLLAHNKKKSFKLGVKPPH
ncbi:hypothetical protein KIW84_046200 [Lathyrus oleraceus]|uniref:Uncharacterized protein n=1 Tax=Pisum sativum TaxID=3888 RepID=A0A9D5AV76_PEA|nr:hypothetical protein KIW84_046200 [Pisum sativum]